MSVTIDIQAAGGTDIGLRRQKNEDAFNVRNDLGLFLVADGMGGHAAGGVASSLAVDAIAGLVESLAHPWPGDAHGSPNDPRALLVAAIKHANTVIHRAAAQDPTKRGMGTTVVAALAQGCHVWLAHVGDSRVYLFRDGHLVQLTQDHTVANMWIREGMAVDVATNLAEGRKLSRALGTEPTIVVDVREEEMRPGDVLLLTSDGVHGLVQEGELVSILAELGNLNEGVERILARANANGGRDNSTAILVRWSR